MHQMTDNNNLRHHTTTQIGAVLSQLEKMEQKMETQLRELKSGLERSEEKLEGEMVAGQKKMETQVKELKESIQSLNKFAIAIRLHHLLRNLTAIANLFKDGMDSFNSFLICVSIFSWPATLFPSISTLSSFFERSSPGL